MNAVNDTLRCLFCCILACSFHCIHPISINVPPRPSTSKKSIITDRFPSRYSSYFSFFLNDFRNVYQASWVRKNRFQKSSLAGDATGIGPQ